MRYEIFISRKPLDGRDIKQINGIPVVVAVPVGEGEILFSTQIKVNCKADAIVTDKTNHWIGVLTADELPVFIIAEEAIGVVHGSWKNISKGTLFRTVKYIERFSKVSSAILGVPICENCYLVEKEIYDKFPSEFKSCFKPTPAGKYFLDLRKAATLQLSVAGVKNIGMINGCTVCNNDIYHSYAKEKTEKRILSAIRILR
jgi:copper oxidase (laccase) domain-containing protein